MLKGDCLRVLSPKTEDGNRPRIGTDGRIEYKEEFLPLTAKRALERQNNRLPAHLKKIIEPVITREAVKPGPVVQDFNLGNGTNETVAGSQEFNIVNSGSVAPARKKPGPKPKHA